jgi:hypothetical protein
LDVAREHVEAAHGPRTFAGAAGDETDLLRASARQMLEMGEHVPPERIRQGLAERAAEARELGIDVDADPYGPAELVRELAEDADAAAWQLEQQRAQQEVQEAFEDWIEDTFGEQEVREHVASLPKEERPGFLDVLVSRFQEEHGADVDERDLVTDDLESELKPNAFERPSAGSVSLPDRAE